MTLDELKALEKRAAEMEALLREGLAYLDERNASDVLRARDWPYRIRAILAPSPDPDAGAKEMCGMWSQHARQFPKPTYQQAWDSYNENGKKAGVPLRLARTSVSVGRESPGCDRCCTNFNLFRQCPA